jgi:hypothetical protein
MRKLDLNGKLHSLATELQREAVPPLRTRAATMLGETHGLLEEQLRARMCGVLQPAGAGCGLESWMNFGEITSACSRRSARRWSRLHLGDIMPSCRARSQYALPDLGSHFSSGLTEVWHVLPPNAAWPLRAPIRDHRHDWAKRELLMRCAMKAVRISYVALDTARRRRLHPDSDAIGAAVASFPREGRTATRIRGRK